MSSEPVILASLPVTLMPHGDRDSLRVAGGPPEATSSCSFFDTLLSHPTRNHTMDSSVSEVNEVVSSGGPVTVQFEKIPDLSTESASHSVDLFLVTCDSVRFSEFMS